MHQLSKLSLANRSVVALLTAIIAVFGFISLGSLRQELFPSIEVPQAAIVTVYAGASPTVVDAQVSQPVEAAVRGLDGVTSTSTTSQSSMSIVRVGFDYGTTTAQVSERLSSALATITGLPSGVTPKLVSGSLDDIPVIALGVSSNNGNNEQLSKVISDVASPILSSVAGVRDVAVDGILTKRINLTLNAAKMKAAGLTAQSISTALASNGFVMPAGSIVDSQGAISIQVGSAVDTIAAVKSIPLIGTSTSYASMLGASTSALSSSPSMSSAAAAAAAGKSAAMGATAGAGNYAAGAGNSAASGSAAGATGATSSAAGAAAAYASAASAAAAKTSISAVTIGDIAKVDYVTEPNQSISRINGKPALTISITKTQDGNTVAISHAVAKLLPDLKQKLGNVTITTELDQAPFVEKSLNDLTQEGLLGLGFAILIILLFLWSVRSTLVTAISIPTSVLITFIGLNLTGYSLNLFTLSALTIAIGRVVDDSIVVIENINRHISYGEPKLDAIRNAVREVAGAITAATVTTIAVFLPIALVGGLVGELFRPFAFTFAIALAASLLVSLTIVPVLAYWFMKAANTDADSESTKKKLEAARHEEEEKERNSRLQRSYLPILKTTQAHPVITLVSAALILVVTFGMVGFLKTNFIGSSGSNIFDLNEELKAGASQGQQNAASIKLENLVLAHKEVTTVLTTVGSAGDGRVAFGASAGGIQLQVTTKDGVDQSKLQNDILAAAKKDSSLGTVTLQQGGGSFGSSGTIDVKITATNDAALNGGVAAVNKAMQGTANVSEITNSLATDQRTLQVSVNRMKAAKLGLSEVAVSAMVAGIMNPSSIGKVNIDGTSTPIYVVTNNTPKTISQVEHIAVTTATGSVALSSIAKIKLVNVPTTITGEQGNQTATVSLTPKGDNLGAITTEVTKRLAKVNLPAGATATIGGVSKDQADSFGQLGIALLAAIAIVYLVMVATFRSLLQPILLLTSIPFAATGAFIALLVSNTALGLPALIGMLLLVGIVVTNAIVLIDLMNQYRNKGMGVRDAILNGARQRLRPILMTALATIFALTPMAIGATGGGGFISQPLAVVVIGGLFSSTILTLVIVPVLYWLAAGRSERKLAKAQRKSGTSTTDSSNAGKPAKKTKKPKAAKAV